MKEKVQDAALYAVLVAVGVFLGAYVAPSVADYRMATQYAQAVTERAEVVAEAQRLLEQRDKEIARLRASQEPVEDPEGQ